MAYTYREAVKTAYKYLDIDSSKVKVIENTNNRGIVYSFSGMQTVVFIYPISCKQNNKQNFFDTRDSGAKERGVAWKYAVEHDMRYFCLGFNEEQDRYKNYVLSLESDEQAISNISFRKSTDIGSKTTGTQVNIPNDFIPKKDFERIKTAKGFYISAIKKEYVQEYLRLFDNRPYMLNDGSEIQVDIDEEDPEERNKRLFRYWMEQQVKPEGDSDAGEPYSKESINSYVSNISNTFLEEDSQRSLFFTDDVLVVKDRIIVLETTEKKNNTQRSAVKKYLQYLIALKGDCMPLIFNTKIEAEYERNRIVFGAPGTGKSFELKEDCNNYLKNTYGTYERVTFHPDYTYSQFVGAYKPVTDEDGKIRYDFVPGPFMRVYVDALKTGRTDSPQPHILIIEEINRAKVAAVFGDVFQLLDRDDDGVSEYEIQATEDVKKYLAKELGGKPENYQRIRIPNNMFIWATMNSADQGVFPMDTAFKRRWNFEYLGINQNDDQIKGTVMLGTDETQDVEWNILRRAINEKLASEYKVNEDKLMGPFFLSKKVIKTISDMDDTIADTDKFMDAFKSKVLMYLYEDAAKQHKHKLFAGCSDTTKYSSVCDDFDRIGMKIFGDDFEERYYLPQKGM